MAFQPATTLRSRTYLGLIVAQFLAAFNDQCIHASAMFYAFNHGMLTREQAISLMPILFYAPWAIFCTLAGYLADRFSKRQSLVFWKVAEIGITVSDHTLYFTVTSRGAYKIVPVRQAGPDGEQNEYARTKEVGLIDGIDRWVRLYTDQENRCYRVFPAPVGRFADPVLPELKQAKIFRLGFRDKGRLIDSRDHALYLKWAARDNDRTMLYAAELPIHLSR